MVLKLFGKKTLNGIKFFIKGSPVFSSGPKSLLTNTPDCPILCNLVFDNFIFRRATRGERG